MMNPHSVPMTYLQWLDKVIGACARGGLIDELDAAARAMAVDQLNERPALSALVWRTEGWRAGRFDANELVKAQAEAPDAVQVLVDVLVEKTGIHALDALLVLSRVPAVGKACTRNLWSDRDGCTIWHVSPSRKSFWYHRDEARRVDSNRLSEDQTWTWEYTPRPTLKDRCEVAKLNRVKGYYLSSGNSISMGYRITYRDPHF